MADGKEMCHVTDDELKVLKEKEFKIFELPHIESAVTTDFVYTTPLSVWMAPGRIFPRLNAYIEVIYIVFRYIRKGLLKDVFGIPCCSKVLCLLVTVLEVNMYNL